MFLSYDSVSSANPRRFGMTSIGKDCPFDLTHPTEMQTNAWDMGWLKPSLALQ